MRPGPTREASRHESTDPQKAGALPLRAFFPHHAEDDGAGPREVGIFGNARLRPAKRRASRPAAAFARKQQCKKMRPAADGGPQNDAQGQAFQPWTAPCANGRAAQRRADSPPFAVLPRPTDVFTSSARILRPSRLLSSKPLLHNRLSHGRRSSASGSEPKIQGAHSLFPAYREQTVPAPGQLAALQRAAAGTFFRAILPRKRKIPARSRLRRG